MYNDEELQTAIRHAAEGQPVEPIDTGRVTLLAFKRARRRRTLVTGVGIAVLTLGLGGGIALKVGSNGPREVLGSTSPGCGVPADASIAGPIGNSTVPMILSSDGKVSVTALLQLRRPAKITAFGLLLGKPGTQASVGDGAINLPDAASNPSNQLAVSDSSSVNLTDGASVTLTTQGLTTGKYPVFADIHYQDTAPCNGVTATDGESMSQVGIVAVGG